MTPTNEPERLPLRLLPVPHSLVELPGRFALQDRRLLVLDAPEPQALLSGAERFQRALQEACDLRWEIVASASAPPEKVGLVIHLDPHLAIPPQGYELSVSEQGIQAVASQPAGAFYAICTLIQLVNQHCAGLPCLQISDRPDFPARGVMLDISRDRVPTMETLLSLVDRLAGWKINQLQLYMEHTFAYQNHPQVWATASPMTGQEILELDRFCRARFIELVPNQQSFGHLAPWLNLPEYKHLAEVEDGFQTPWGEYRQGAFSLAPVEPGSLDFLRGLYAELLPHFSSPLFNVGCDETWDLGQGRSQAACETLGKGRVYLDFLLQIFEEVRRCGRTPQFWGDIITEHPELIPELPKDVIAMEWGYEAAHPFDEHGAQFAASGIPFYVCPGTSAWCSLAGRSDNAVENLRRAAEYGLKHGAIGYLNTDWGDSGHWQTWPVSELGLMLGAAYSWGLAANAGLEIAPALSWHAFGDASGQMGRLAYDLGNAYRLLGFEPHNSSLLFWALQFSLAQIKELSNLTAEIYARAEQAIAAIAAPLAEIEIGRADGDLVRAELGLTVRMLKHACRRGLLGIENDPERAAELRSELAPDLEGLLAAYRTLWLARNRPGGLPDSLARLENLRQDYL